MKLSVITVALWLADEDALYLRMRQSDQLKVRGVDDCGEETMLALRQ